MIFIDHDLRYFKFRGHFGEKPLATGTVQRTAKKTGFTKAFSGDKALEQIHNPEYTYGFLGDDLRKASTHAPAVVLDSAGNKIGVFQTCATDMDSTRNSKMPRLFGNSNLMLITIRITCDAVRSIKPTKIKLGRKLW